MLTHRHNLRYDGLISPLDTKDLGKFLQVLGRGFSNGEDSVAEPAHAQAAELLVKELDTKLRSEKGYVFNDG